MIGEVQQTLKKLLIDPEDPFHAHVRSRLGKKATDHFERKVKQFILRMPAVVSRIDRLLLNDRTDPAARRLAQELLIYLYDPTDFLPERDEGLFGYLDDAFYVAIVYLKIVRAIDPSLVTDEDRDIRDWLLGHLQTVRYLIPEESRRIEKAVSDIEAGRLAEHPVYS